MCSGKPSVIPASRKANNSGVHGNMYTKYVKLLQCLHSHFSCFTTVKLSFKHRNTDLISTNKRFSMPSQTKHSTQVFQGRHVSTAGADWHKMADRWTDRQHKVIPLCPEFIQVTQNHPQTAQFNKCKFPEGYDRFGGRVQYLMVQSNHCGCKTDMWYILLRHNKIVQTSSPYNDNATFTHIPEVNQVNNSCHVLQ